MIPALALVAALIATPVLANGRAVDAAIVFVVDRSISMQEDEAAIVTGGHVRAITSMEVLSAVAEGKHSAIAASFVEFGNNARIRVGWTVIDGSGAAETFARAILEEPESPIGTASTSITDGLQAAYSLLVSHPYNAKKLVVDVVGDGNHNRTGVDPPDAIRDAILALGATINGMPLIIDPANYNLVDHYADHVVGGPAHFNLPVHRIEEFPVKIRQKLVMELF